VLNQNHPNPFKEQTTISFLIPDNIASAKIIFIDNLGNVRTPDLFPLLPQIAIRVLL